MATVPPLETLNRLFPSAKGLPLLFEVHELIRLGRVEEHRLFELFARLARTAGREDLGLEFDQRARGQVVSLPTPERDGKAPSPPSPASGPDGKANPAVAALRSQGLRLSQQGKLAEAEQQFRLVIQQCPNEAQGYGDLGVVLARLRRVPEAEAAFRLSVQLEPTNAVTCLNLGRSCLDQNKLAEAESWVRQSVLLRPGSAEALQLLGTILERQNKPEAAGDAYQELVRLKPKDAEAHLRLGRLRKRTDKPREAEAAFREAVRLRPDHADSWNSLGAFLESQERHGEAEPCYREALRIKPDSAEYHNNLGVVVGAQDRPEEAEVCYREALRLRPDFAAVHSNLGNALRNLGRTNEAIGSLRTAIRLAPKFAEAHNNVGIALTHSGQVAEGIAEYDQAIRLRHDYSEAHLNRALALLSLGDFRRGWPEYEWRWRGPQKKPPQFKVPRWDGSPLGNRTLLLCAEQGLGDTIQFVRYAALVRGEAGKVVLDCPTPLCDLMKSCAGLDQVVPRGQPLPPFDTYVTMLTVPDLLGTNLDNIPGHVPYLFAKPEQVEFWRDKLKEVTGFRVGIFWQGSKQHKGDRNRSVGLTRFAALAAIPGVRSISLQKGVGSEQLAEAPAEWGIVDPNQWLNADSWSFLDTAALLLNLDLVVTVDTAVAHLTGALGKPVWVATGFASDWRWLREREDTPWYPTMRLFRQPVFGNWDAAFERIAQALGEEARKKSEGIS